MSLHQATIYWTREPHSTDNSTYSRNHAALLNGQQSVKLSASVDALMVTSSSSLPYELLSMIFSSPVHASVETFYPSERLSTNPSAHHRRQVKNRSERREMSRSGV